MNAGLAYGLLVVLTGTWTSATLVGAIYAILNVRRSRGVLALLAPWDSAAARAAKDQIAINLMIAAGHTFGLLPAIAGFGLRREAIKEGYSAIAIGLTACIVGLMMIFAFLAFYIRHADRRLMALVKGQPEP